ncbi:hypothetical protein RSOL_229420 [Rhizoctonia solani AG-3 Rhs1AP]|nr:hypothetical protein RSOL_229420 [Rhizoctonia solani AG-3 Rhs1AP]
MPEIPNVHDSPNRTRFAQTIPPFSNLPPVPAENPPAPAENILQANTPEPHVPGHLPEDVEAENGPPIEVVQLAANGPAQGASTLLHSLFGLPFGG